MRGLAFTMALALLAAACGKQGDLEPPPGAELYKQSYPAADTVLPPPDTGESEEGRE